MNNIVEAVFGTCNPYECATRILYRYDYGMILTFPDLELPTAYEVHFSNYDDVGTTITQIGNEDGVSIPDEFLQTGLPVYCWVYLHTGEDDGETVYKVTINVKDRPQPSNGTPTPVQQDAITEAIAALDSAVEQMAEALEIVEGAAEIVEAADEAAERANTAAESIERMRFYVEDGYLYQDEV